MRKNKALAITAMIAMCATSATDAHAESLLIGFNGGGSIHSNTGDFENEIKFYRDSFFKGQGKILNGGGTNGVVIPVDRYGFVDRNIFGQIQLKPNALPGEAATEKNLSAIVSDATKKKPEAVTIVFSDHGDRDKLTAWNEEITYSNIQSIDQQFGSETVVRRIHTHCYSGAALVGLKNPIGATEALFLASYPKNRCGFAGAMENEFAYDIVSDDWDETNTFKPLKQIKPGPSLQDIKDAYEKNKTYRASPQLTSDYFLRDFFLRECSLRPGELACLAKESEETQARRLSSVVDRMTCARTDVFQQTVLRNGLEINEAYTEYSKLRQLRARVSIEFLQKRFPTLYPFWAASAEASSALAKCAASPTRECAELKDRRLAVIANPNAKAFLEKYLALTEHPQYSKVVGLDYVTWSAEDAEFRRAVGLAFAKSEKAAGRSAQVTFRNFEQQYQSAGEKLALVQLKQKQFVRTYRDEQMAVMKSALDRPGAAAAKARYEEIRACETSPINGPISGPISASASQKK